MTIESTITDMNVRKEISSSTISTWFVTATILLFMVALIVGHLYPTSIIGESIDYLGSISSVILVILTLAYVLTTNRQLNAMKEQIKVMDKSFNHQVQPLVVPSLDNAYLEKLRAYYTPVDNFNTLYINYRLHHKIKLKNVGTGAALNIVTYSSFPSKNDNDAPVYFSKDQVHCLSSNERDESEINILGLDRKFNILQAIRDGNMIINTDIFYKNIFGAGFHEKVTFNFYLDSEDEKLLKDWQEFFDSGINKYDDELKRYSALHKELPKDAKVIHERLNTELEQKFTKDIKLSYRISKESFDITFVDYKNEIARMDKLRKEQFEIFSNKKKKD